MFMKFLDKIKKAFERKDSISKEEVKKVLGNDTKLSEETPEQNADIKEAVAKSELLEILSSAKPDHDSLALDKIQGEAETIANYIRALLKDLDQLQPEAKEKKHLESALDVIGKKIKMIARHSLALKNLLAILEDHYYSPIIGALSKVNKKVNKKEIQELIERVEKQRQSTAAMDSSLTRLIGYDEIFNPERNPEYRIEIEKEAKKRLLHGHLNELLDSILILTTDKALSIKSQIENFNPLEEAKRFI